jgi:pilus assembly protein CpaF
MFAIIISEKGGAERRETFDKNEINVGRVQGNDLMLPKGNVSKHHARLLYRDGRFIVTDLKSTNGTYVNGRKIAQATIVREGDKIYIGDFVLRLDSGEAQADATGDEVRMGSSASASGASSPMLNRPAGMPPLPQDGGPNAFGPAMGAEPPTGDHDVEATAGLATPPGAMRMPAPPRVPTTMSSPGAGPQPGLGVGPRPASGPIHTPGPEPARMGMAPGGAQMKPGSATLGLGGGVSPGGLAPMQAPAHDPMRAPMPGGGARPVPAPAPGPGPLSPAPAPRPSGPAAASGAPSRVPPRETPAQVARRIALTALVDRVTQATDTTQLKTTIFVDEPTVQRFDRVTREQVQQMQNEQELSEGVEPESLVRDAMRELIGFGPVGTLLEDDEVSEIHILRHDHVVAVRGGSFVSSDAPITSDEALRRIIWRLVQQSGDLPRHGEVVVQRSLSRTAHMTAVVPPASSWHSLVVRKRRRLDMSLDDFVRLGGLSRAMATFLENCLQAHANLMVCGSNGQAVASFLAALASATPAGERVCVVQEVDEFLIPHAQVASLVLADLRARGEEAVRAAMRMRPDRTLIANLGGQVVAAAVEAIGEGNDGILAAMTAPSLRQGISRLVTELVMARPGIGVDAARECVGESFDIALEVAPMADGRHRVVRMVEFGGSDAKGVVVRDLFNAAEGGDGTFNPTGVVPRVVAEFSNRGVKVDANLFKRAAGRN